MTHCTDTLQFSDVLSSLLRLAGAPGGAAGRGRGEVEGGEVAAEERHLAVYMRSSLFYIIFYYILILLIFCQEVAAEERRLAV